MAHNSQLAIARWNAALDAAFDALNSGLLRVYDGTQPTDADTAIGSQVQLSELSLGATAFGAASSGSKAANAIASDNSADATGTASWHSLLLSGGTRVIDGSVGTANADLVLDTVSINATEVVACSSYVISSPVAVGIVFPLQVASSGRYLEDQNGVPVRIQSEAAWVIATRASLSDVDTYIASRVARGFNAVHMMAMVRGGGTYGWPENNVNADNPFNTSHDLSDPNDDYWDFLEQILDKFEAANMIVELFFCYAGYDGGDQGWYEVLAESQNTQSVCFAFGQYLGARLAGRDNITLMAGGDYTMPAGETRTRMHKILEGLRDAGCAQLCGSEWGLPDTLITDQGGYTYGTDPSSSDCQLDTFYGWGDGGSGNVWETLA